MTSPAVSIVILSYDRPAYLREALDSVAAQTSNDYEVVIADDCSPNSDVDALLRDYSTRFERFVYEKPERNVGVVANLLRAVSRSSGRYVTILCDDDAFEPDYVLKMSAALDADPGLAFVFCNVRIMLGDGRIDAGETTAYDARWGRDRLGGGVLTSLLDVALVSRTLQPAMGAMFRKSAVDWGDFPEDTAGAWDLWLGYLSARESGRCAFLTERLFRYRQHENMLTARRDVKWYRGIVNIYTRFYRDDRLVEYRSLFRERLERYHNALGMALLRRGDNAKARVAFVEGRAFGSSLKTRIGSFLTYLPSPVSRTIFSFYDK